MDLNTDKSWKNDILNWEPKLILTTTFSRKDEKEQLYTYSRTNNPNIDLVEANLSEILRGQSIVYSSGIAALFAILFLLKPKRVLYKVGYYANVTQLVLFKEFYNMQIINLNETEKANKLIDFLPGDVLLLENPVNPTGEIIDLSYYIQKVKETNLTIKNNKDSIKVICDATLAPPPLFNPFEYGVDIILHSATKFLGGHSDVLAGVISSQNHSLIQKLKYQRGLMGSILGNLECYLLNRSLKTLKLRVLKQSQTCIKLIQFLNELILKSPFNQLIFKIVHEFNQINLPKYSSSIHSPVFSIIFQHEDYAKQFPFLLTKVKVATSIGGCITLIERRAIYDQMIDPRLCRISVGLEEVDILKEDFKLALNQLKIIIKI